MTAKIRFRVPHLLWGIGDVQEFGEPGATELVVSGIAEYVDERSHDEPSHDEPLTRPAVALAPTALPTKKKRTRTR